MFDVELAAPRDASPPPEETERRRDASVTTLRHELRTPLNAIKGFADLLQAEIDGPLTDAQREDVEAIASAGRHLLRLVDDVLDLSAIATGRFAVERVPCDLAAITRAAVSEPRASRAAAAWSSAPRRRRACPGCAATRWRCAAR
ncbi:MAG: histidine kinase dimerization/phospho-acceptor domain-containing protein [Polyangiales bacterium]